MLIKPSLKATCAKAFKPASNARTTIVCKASAKAGSDNAVSRRNAVAALSFAPFAFLAPQAHALILDEEDEEMLEKAKANRKAKLAADKVIERNFLEEEGIKNKELSNDLVPVQKAIYNMAKSGSSHVSCPKSATRAFLPHRSGVLGAAQQLFMAQQPSMAKAVPMP